MNLRLLALTLTLAPLLTGCFNGKTSMLNALPGKQVCPFNDNVEYIGYDVYGSETGNPFGNFVFVNEPDNGRCILKSATNLTSDGNEFLKNQLSAVNTVVDTGQYVSWPGAVIEGPEYSNFVLMTHFEDGLIEIRSGCTSTNPDSQLIIPGVPLVDKKSCTYNTEKELMQLVSNYSLAQIDKVFAPASMPRKAR